MRHIRVTPKTQRRLTVVETEAERGFCEELGLVAEQVNRTSVEMRVFENGTALVTFVSTVTVTAEQAARAMEQATKADMFVEIGDPDVDVQHV